MATKSADRELWIQDAALVSLLDGLAVEPDGLRDIDGQLHRTNAVGNMIATTIESPSALAEVVEAMVDRYGMDHATARADLVAYLGDLDERRLVSIRQSFVAEFWVRLRHAVLSLVFAFVFHFRRERQRYPSRRYRPSAGRVLFASIEAHQSTVAIGMLLIGAWTAVGAVRSLSQDIPVANSLSLLTTAILFCYLFGLIGSVVLHEFGHYAAAKVLKVPMLSVFARMGCAGLSHLDRSPGSTAAVTAAGPLAGMAGPLVLTYVSYSMGSAWLAPLHLPNAHVALAFCWAALALLQLPCLTPFTGEGRRLATSLARAVAARRAGRIPVTGGISR